MESVPLIAAHMQLNEQQFQEYTRLSIVFDRWHNQSQLTIRQFVEDSGYKYTKEKLSFVTHFMSAYNYFIETGGMPILDPVLFGKFITVYNSKNDRIFPIP